MQRRLFAYDDALGWGKMLCAAFADLGHSASLFTRARTVPDEEGVVAFIHLTHLPFSERRKNKTLAEKLHKKNNIRLIPTINECRLYDDKVLQFQQLEQWMPKTWYVTDRAEVEPLVDSIGFPIVSKTREGAGSSNVRLIETKAQALAEAQAVFSKRGLKCFRKNCQRGYLLWQEFLAQNPNDWRVVLLAKKYAMILKRYNRPDLPFASGSGRFEMIAKATTALEDLLSHARVFASELNFTLLGVDIVYGKNRNPVILETTVGWDLSVYSECVFFEHKAGRWVPTEYRGKTMFRLIAQAIMRRDFDD